MRVLFTYFVFLTTGFVLVIPVFPQSNSYTWVERYEQSENIVNRIPLPNGYERINTIPGPFEDWLRHLPLKTGKPPVHLARPNFSATGKKNA